MLFTNNSKFPLGLDISDLCLKIVQLQKKGTSKPKIQALGRIDVPPGLICNGEIKNIDKVAELIRQLVSKPQYGKVSSYSAVVSLPETKTFIKLIEVQKNPNDLADIIEAEMQKHVPMLISDIYYDWQIIEEKNDMDLVLIGAAPRNIVNQYNDLLDKAKLSVEALEIEPVSIARAVLEEESPNFKKENLKNNYALIDIGAKRTSLIVYSKNTILFTASVPISGEKITLEIADNLEINLDQAEKAKIICGLNDKKTEAIIKEVLSGTIGELNDRIKEIIEFNDNHFPQFGAISKIELCGGGANIKGINDVINNATKIQVSGANPLINLGNTKEEFVKFLMKVNSSNSEMIQSRFNIETFATAIGLALRGVFITSL